MNLTQDWHRGDTKVSLSLVTPTPILGPVPGIGYSSFVASLTFMVAEVVWTVPLAQGLWNVAHFTQGSHSLHSLV